jgi:hypothetical protein
MVSSIPSTMNSIWLTGESEHSAIFVMRYVVDDVAKKRE